MQPDFPSAPMLGLDTLWFQVAGTVCNLACRHCFISCSPTNHAHEMMDLASVEAYLAQAEGLGVREYYFTGGEPFLNPDILDILRAALRQGPCSVLTNGTLITAKRAQDLMALADGSRYSLEIRLSLDGLNSKDNDALRGEGSFDRIFAAVRHLAAAGINPVITLTEACDDAGSSEGRARALDFLRSMGLERPRLKVMPILHLGAEESRTRGYAAGESLRGMTLDPEQAAALQCSSGRMVTSKGVYVCPILIDFEDARMGSNLQETLRPHPLRQKACHTCHVQGLNCRT
jgi:sulfatase maturation enzyme AslB (radical SAM superfamily)